MAGEVDQVGEDPADGGVDGNAVDLGRAEGLATGPVGHWERANGRADDQVVVGKRALDRVVDLRPDDRVLDGRERGLGGELVEPEPRRSRDVVAREQVQPLCLHAEDRRQGQPRPEPAPHVAELALVVADAELDLLDVGAGVLEMAQRAPHHPGDARVDGVDVEVRGVGDPQPTQVAVEDGFIAGALIEAERVPGVVSLQRLQPDDGVLDGARQQTLVDERRDRPERVGRMTTGTRPTAAL